MFKMCYVLSLKMDELRVVKYSGTTTSDGTYRPTPRKYSQQHMFLAIIATIKVHRTVGLARSHKGQISDWKHPR